MKKALIGSILGLLLAFSGFVVVYFVYYPRIAEYQQEIQALEEELARLKDRLKTLQEIAEASTAHSELFALNGSRISYDLWFTVNSTSMLPTLMVGDIVYVLARTNDSVITVDDIIVFFNPNAWNTITIHRVVEVQIIDSKLFYYTQGDNKSSRDPWPIPLYNVIGIAVVYRRGDFVDFIE